MALPSSKNARAMFFGIFASVFATVGFLAWFAAERRCQDMVVGERNAGSLVIVKALTQLREGRTEDAMLVLETSLDMNVSYVWAHRPDSDKTTNILSAIRRYRLLYPAFSETLRSNGNPVLLERHEQARNILMRHGATN